jgi:Spy/CpxP family protein refolding chaperone
MGLLVLALTAPVVPAVQAQNEGGRGGGPAEMVQRMTQDLGLTPDQQARVRTLLNASEASGKAKFQERERQLRSFLTPQQVAQLDKLQAASPQGMGAGGPGPGGSGGGEGNGPLSQLNLTADQKSKVQAWQQQNRIQKEAEQKQFDASLNLILTPAQRTRLEQLRAQHGGRGGQR